MSRCFESGSILAQFLPIMVSTELTTPIESYSMRKKHIITSLGLVLSLLTSPIIAGGHTTIVDQWYEALQQADETALAPLLAPNAEIVLQDLDIIQTREEFLASMEDWKAAIEGGELRHAITRTNDNMITVEVCYDFPENNILMEEIFSLDAGLISKQVQTQMSDDC